jgi:hypothetical protein
VVASSAPWRRVRPTFWNDARPPVLLRTPISSSVCTTNSVASTSSAGLRHLLPTSACRLVWPCRVLLKPEVSAL